MTEKKLRPLTPKQQQGLAALQGGGQVPAPRIGGLRVGDALVAHGFATQGPLVRTSATITAKGTSVVLQPCFIITDAGLVALGLRSP